jgi:hypothetical protein
MKPTAVDPTVTSSVEIARPVKARTIPPSKIPTATMLRAKMASVLSFLAGFQRRIVPS